MAMYVIVINLTKTIPPCFCKNCKRRAFHWCPCDKCRYTTCTLLVVRRVAMSYILTLICFVLFFTSFSFRTNSPLFSISRREVAQVQRERKALGSDDRPPPRSYYRTHEDRKLFHVLHLPYADTQSFIPLGIFSKKHPAFFDVTSNDVEGRHSTRPSVNPRPPSPAFVPSIREPFYIPKRIQRARSWGKIGKCRACKSCFRLATWIPCLVRGIPYSLLLPRPHSISITVTAHNSPHLLQTSSKPILSFKGNIW